jgi:hypothetical protein
MNIFRAISQAFIDLFIRFKNERLLGQYYF